MIEWLRDLGRGVADAVSIAFGFAVWVATFFVTLGLIGCVVYLGLLALGG